MDGVWLSWCVNGLGLAMVVWAIVYLFVDYLQERGVDDDLGPGLVY